MILYDIHYNKCEDLCSIYFSVCFMKPFLYFIFVSFFIGIKTKIDLITVKVPVK